MSGYTDEELALLSDEERDAIAADSPEADRAALEAIAGEDDDSQGDDAGASQDAAIESAGSSEEAAVAEQHDVSHDDDKQPFVPTYRADPVENYAEKVDALDAAFEQGDIDLKSYNAQRDALVRAQLKAEIAKEQQAQVEAQLWEREVSDFKDDHPEYKTSKVRHAALDAVVKDLAADEANVNKTGRWFLREAHRIVQEEFGARAETRVPEKTPERTPQKQRTPDLSVVPKSLSHLPAADIPETGAVDEFAHLDRMTGIELENAVARLSPAERERYRQAA